jgi:hypothetical protein
MKTPNTIFLCVLLLLAITLAATGCRKEASVNQTGEAQPQQSPAKSLVDLGDFKLRYVERKKINASDPERKVGSNPEAMQKVVLDINEQIALPYDISVSFEDCEGPDAYYDREMHQITVCYQLIDDYYDIFSLKLKDKTKLDEAVKGATASTFFHELGHALIDVLKLPATGKEEDAADQLSTLVLINRTEGGEEMALNGALSFKLYAELDKGVRKIYWDEHSLDEQRFYDSLCLIYGHDPVKYDYLVKDGTLPEERAGMCTEDNKKLAWSWHQLLLPHLKDGRPLSKLGQK